MGNLNHIGIDKKQAKILAKELNDLLSNYQVFYMNTRGFHWNIKGQKFFELHLKFEELYNDLILKIDEIAERILTLGFTPTHSYVDYIDSSKVKPRTNVSDGVEAVQSILDSFEVLISKERQLLTLAGAADDEGTSALMSDYIREQEKLVWMYRSFMA